MPKLTLEGWIRGKLLYSGFYGDANAYYTTIHKEFTSEDKETRIKGITYEDADTGIIYSAVFGYDEIGIKFTVSSNTTDFVQAFGEMLSKSVIGYKNFRKFFLEEIAPKKANLEFFENSEKMLIVPYTSGNWLSAGEEIDLINKAKDVLKANAAEVEFIRTNVEKSKEESKHKIEPLTLNDLELLSKYDFIKVIVVLGNPYVFVEHHFFANSFILDDPSLSVNYVAKWGFITSLKLQDINYDLDSCIAKVRLLRERIDNLRSKKIPYQVTLLKQDLIETQKLYAIVEDDLREFSLLSEKISGGLLIKSRIQTT